MAIFLIFSNGFQLGLGPCLADEVVNARFCGYGCGRGRLSPVIITERMPTNRR